MVRHGILAVLACLVFGVAVAAEKPVSVAVICKAMDSTFWSQVRDGAQKAATELGPDKVVLNVLAPDREVNVQQQVQIVEDVIVQGVDVICLAPCGSKELIPVMEAAQAAGIPIIVFDTDTPWEGKAAFIGTNEVRGGELVGEFIAKELNGKGTVALIGGVMGHQTSIDRLQGCKSILAKHPEITIVSEQPANSERSLAMTVTENILTANPDLGALFTINAEMAMGALEAVEMNKGDTKVVGYYQDPSALQAIKDGRLAGLVSMSPFGMGELAVQNAYALVRGETIPERIDTPMGFVSSENIDEWVK
ncbi:MAG: sugar ABC transporter substrate-binding protein [Planctomycetaceae bacterium]|nr:sugar ABC transporter substrate-binding protein [Planctomycetaceae bacterium]